MSIWSELFSFEPPSDDTPELPPRAPEGFVRVYFFSGVFATEEELVVYCFGDDDDADSPTPLTRALPGAYIDTSYLVAGYQDQVGDVLSDFFSPEQVDALQSHMGTDNSVVIMSEYAFGGFPFSLGDTENLRFHGAFLIKAPEPL